MKAAILSMIGIVCSLLLMFGAIYLAVSCGSLFWMAFIGGFVLLGLNLFNLLKSGEEFNEP